MLTFSLRETPAARWSASAALRSPCGLPRPTRSCSSGTTRSCRSGVSSGGTSGRRSLMTLSCSSRSTPSRTSRVCLLPSWTSFSPSQEHISGRRAPMRGVAEGAAQSKCGCGFQLMWYFFLNSMDRPARGRGEEARGPVTSGLGQGR